MLHVAENDVEFLRAVGADNPISKVGIANFDSPVHGVAVLRTLRAKTQNRTSTKLQLMAAWAAHFGDMELALEWLKEALDLRPIEIMWVWQPVFSELRRQRGFKQLVREQGLVEYWKRFRWPVPPLCRPIDNDDLECDWPKR